MTGIPPRLRALRLRTAVFIWRQGIVWVLALALLVLAGSMLLANRYLLQSRLSRHTQGLAELQSSRDALRQVQDTAARQTLDPFASAQVSLRSVMVKREALPGVIRTIHEAAQRHRIAVFSSDYQLKEQGRNGFLQQTMTLPMQVGYGQFKPFLFDVLRTHPGMAVDQISIKREAVAQAAPEIVLRLSVWVDAKPGPEEGVRP